MLFCGGQKSSQAPLLESKWVGSMQKIISFELNMGGIDAENHEESDNRGPTAMKTMTIAKPTSIWLFTAFGCGAKSPPRASFGVNMGGVDAENHKESETRAQL